MILFDLVLLGSVFISILLLVSATVFVGKNGGKFFLRLVWLASAGALLGVVVVIAGEILQRLLAS